MHNARRRVIWSRDMSSQYFTPASTQRNKNIIMALKTTSFWPSQWRYFSVMCPQGHHSHQANSGFGSPKFRSRGPFICNSSKFCFVLDLIKWYPGCLSILLNCWQHHIIKSWHDSSHMNWTASLIDNQTDMIHQSSLQNTLKILSFEIADHFRLISVVDQLIDQESKSCIKWQIKINLTYWHVEFYIYNSLCRLCINNLKMIKSFVTFFDHRKLINNTCLHSERPDGAQTNPTMHTLVHP